MADSGGRCDHWQQVVVAVNDGPGGRRWWVVAMNGGGRRQRTVDKTNRERINWCEVRRIVVNRYKIKREKIGIK